MPRWKYRGPTSHEVFQLFREGLGVEEVARRLRISVKKAHQFYLLFMSDCNAIPEKPNLKDFEDKELIFRNLILPQVQRIFALARNFDMVWIIDWYDQWVYTIKPSRSDDCVQRYEIQRERLLTGI